MEKEPQPIRAEPRDKTPFPKTSYLEGELSTEQISDIKDMLFDQYMKQQLIEDFFSELGEYLDDDEHVDAMKGALANYSDDEVYAAISLPKELRKRQFSLFNEKIRTGIEPAQVMNDLVAATSKYGFGVGYHTSAVDIKPDTSGRWEIIGREHDHRDNDLARAYYSTHYRHLYSPKDHQLYVKKPHPQHIYIVRTEPGHKTDGNWSRASRLSIIAKVPYGDVVKYVESTTKKIEGRR